MSNRIKFFNIGVFLKNSALSLILQSPHRFDSVKQSALGSKKF